MFKTDSFLKRILIYIALVWPFGQLLELPFIGFGRLYLLDLLVLSLFITLISSRRILEQIKKDSLSKPLFIFIAIASLSLLVAIPSLHPSSLVTAFLYLLRFTAYTSIYYAIKQLKQNSQVLKVALCSFSFFTLLGLVQYIFLPDTRFLYYLGFDDHFFRLIGTFLDPNFTSLALLIFILMLLGTKNLKPFAIFPSIALALTFSRATYLVAFVTVLYLLVRSKYKWPFLVLIPIVVLSLYLAPKPGGEGVNLFRTYSIESRLNDSRHGLELFKKRPFLGYGFNTLRSLRVIDSNLPPRALGGLSNSFVFVLVTTGIIGFIAYLNLLRHLLRESWPSPYASAIIIAIILHSLFNNSLFYIWVLVPLWFTSAYKKL